MKYEVIVNPIPGTADDLCRAILGMTTAELAQKIVNEGIDKVKEEIGGVKNARNNNAGADGKGHQ